MKIGKLTNEQLEQLVLSRFSHIRSEVICSPHVGVDCAAVDLGGRIAVLSTDPITSATENLGSITVHVSCNDAAAAGAEPIGLLITFLAPPSVSEADIARVSDEIASAAEAINVEIIGGHTEVTDAVTRIVTCATVIAKANKKGIIEPGGMRVGDDIVLSKHAGLEGAAIIAGDHAGRLSGFSQDELNTARAFFNDLSVVKEGLYAAEHGASAMHDVTEGGVLGAVWEMAFAAGIGIVLDASAIPVHPITKRICTQLALDPLRLISSGAMLIACPDGDALVAGLKEIGVSSAVIGKAQKKGVVLTEGTPIAPPEADELYKLY